MPPSESPGSTANEAIEILFFAQAKEFAQQASLRLAHIEHETVAELRVRVRAEIPRLETLLPHCMFAINEAYANEHSPIPAGAKVACIPPVSGG